MEGVGITEDIREYLLHLLTPGLSFEDNKDANPEEWLNWTLEYMVTGGGYSPQRHDIYDKVTKITELKPKYLKAKSVRRLQLFHLNKNNLFLFLSSRMHHFFHWSLDVVLAVANLFILCI